MPSRAAAKTHEPAWNEAKAPACAIHAPVGSSPTSQHIHYCDGWQRPETPAEPTGGATVDAEARAAIAGLLEALIAAGILAQE